MRVLIATDSRFFRTRDENIYSIVVYDYNFWKRYLQIFDEIVVMARVKDSNEKPPEKMPSNGPGVSFFCLPYYIGAWQYLKQHFKLVSMMSNSVKSADVFILRIPGRVPTLLWYRLMTDKIPYSVEVLGNSADATRTGGFNILIRGIASLLEMQKKQCEHASAASYVTQEYLQRLYPSNGWSTSCSEVILPDDAIISEAGQRERFKSIRDVAAGRRPFRIFHIGTMSALYKAQNVLIKAVYICLKKGLHVELELLGEGIYRKYFKKMANEFGIERNIIFLDRLAKDQEVRNRFDRADLFVLPSLTEGQPRAVIEAMARGVPCIGSNVGGIPELLGPEYLVEPGNAEVLAKKISEVALDPDKLEKMSRRNLEESKKYRLDILNQRRIEFYKKVALLADRPTMHK